MTKTIELVSGKGTVLVDDEDYQWLCQHRWYLSPKGYALTQIYNPELKKQQTHLMHRMILGLERGDKRKTDHINRKKLDNRRCNLRVATTSQNLRNRGKFRSSKSKYKGVHWKKKEQKWGIALQLGLFEDEEEAARVYRWAVKLLFDDEHTLRFYSEGVEHIDGLE